MAEIVFRDKRIFYKTEGEGKPVILLHGFGENGNIWNEQVKKLKQGYFVIVPDLPGSGRSPLLDGPCTLNDYVEVIKEIANKEALNTKGLNQSLFTLIGHSMGGYITMLFAKKHPEILSSIGLFHSSAFADDTEKIKTRKKGIAFIKKNGGNAFLKTIVPGLFYEETRNANPALVKQLLALTRTISDEALIQYYEAMIQRPDTTSVLQSFKKPVLFIIGKHDRVIPLKASLKQCVTPAVAAIHILQNSGHLGMWEEPDLSTKYVTNFLNSFA